MPALPKLFDHVLTLRLTAEMVAKVRRRKRPDEPLAAWVREAMQLRLDWAEANDKPKRRQSNG